MALGSVRHEAFNCTGLLTLVTSRSVDSLVSAEQSIAYLRHKSVFLAVVGDEFSPVLLDSKFMKPNAGERNAVDSHDDADIRHSVDWQGMGHACADCRAVAPRDMVSVYVQHYESLLE